MGDAFMLDEVARIHAERLRQEARASRGPCRSEWLPDRTPGPFRRALGTGFVAIGTRLVGPAALPRFDDGTALAVEEGGTR